MDAFLDLITGGVGNLAAHLAAHVLLCLLPAVFIAGAMTALIAKASITRWLGRNAPYRVAYTGTILGPEFAFARLRPVPALRHRHRAADGAADRRRGVEGAGEPRRGREPLDLGGARDRGRHTGRRGAPARA